LAQNASPAALRHGPKAAPISPHLQRASKSDLDITGMLPGVPAGSSRYLSYADLLRLPQVTAVVTDDPDLGASASHPLRVSGVPLEILAGALGVLPASDLVDALCTDHYRSQFPADYIALHHPILSLKINDATPAVWAASEHRYDPGPYFILYDHFLPAFRVLSHDDEAQLPDNVIRLNFTTATATFDSITPHGNYAADSLVEQGYIIAKQNCLRCHFSGEAGGTKSGVSWAKLSAVADGNDEVFEHYVHDPKSVDRRAKMPGNPQYDAATLAALRAYFGSLN
jgi:mono/diheme cytochrome c family protein